MSSSRKGFTPSFADFNEDICEIISKLILRWAYVEGRSKNAEYERERSRRLSTGTLKALVLVSKRNFRLFMPFLLRDINLTSRHLASFLRLLKAEPLAGSNTRSVLFSMNPNALSMEQQVVSPSLDCLSVEHPMLQTLGKAFTSTRDRFTRGRIPSEASTDEIYEMANYLSHVRGVVLNAMPNLEVLRAEMLEGFPLHRNDSLSSSTMSGYLNNLKDLSLKKQASNLPTCPVRNLIFLLLFLPRLQKLDVDAVYAGSKDFKYFKTYSDQFRGKSKVTNLRFKILFPHPTASDFQTEHTTEVKREIFRKVLSTGSQLEKVSVDQVSSDQSDDNRMTFSSLIRGLSNSASTLRHLDSNGVGSIVYTGIAKDSADFSNLTALESMCLDGACVFSLEAYGTKVILPPNLKSIQLLDNATLMPGIGTTENILAQFLREQKRFLREGFEVKSWREPVARNPDLITISEVPMRDEKREWEGYRREVQLEYAKLGINFNLLDLD